MLAGTGIFLVGFVFAVCAALMVKEGPRDDADVIGLCGMVVLAIGFLVGGVVVSLQAGAHWSASD